MCLHTNKAILFQSEWQLMGNLSHSLLCPLTNVAPMQFPAVKLDETPEEQMCSNGFRGNCDEVQLHVVIFSPRHSAWYTFHQPEIKSPGKENEGVTVEQHVTNHAITYKLPLLCKLQYSHWGGGGWREGGSMISLLIFNFFFQLPLKVFICLFIVFVNIEPATTGAMHQNTNGGFRITLQSVWSCQLTAEMKRKIPLWCL